MATTKQVLKKLAYLIEANTYTLAALEMHLQSSESGKQITNRELNKWKQRAKKETKETFDKLEALIQSLPKRTD